MRRKLIFVNRVFFPDQGATAQILTDVAIHLADKGWSLHVVTSRPHGSGLLRCDTLRGVIVHRITSFSADRSHLVRRAADDLYFHVAATLLTGRLAKPGDILAVKTDPPLISVPMSFVAAVRKADLVTWLQDLYPETAFALGIGSGHGVVGKVLLAARNRGVRGARTVIAIGERMAERLRAMDVDDDAIRIIANFCGDLSPIDFGASPLRAAWGIEPSRFVVGYSGNLGRAHDIDTMLGAAEILRRRPDILFLFSGGGHLRARLAAHAEQSGLTNIICKPYQPREKLADLLAAADIHWVSLRPELEGCILPSKIYAAAAAGRGLVNIGDPDGDVARIIAAHGWGRSFALGASRDVADYLASLADDRKMTAGMGRKARAYNLTVAGRTHVLRQWEKLAEEWLTEPDVTDTSVTMDRVMGRRL